MSCNENAGQRVYDFGTVDGIDKYSQQKTKNVKRRIQNEIGTPQQVGSRNDQKLDSLFRGNDTVRGVK